jgi:hypothetical protein
LYFFVVQEGKFVLADPHPLVDTRIFVQVVIFTEFALVEDLEDHFTPLTAKHLLCRLDFGVQAGLAAVITEDFLVSYYSRGHNR